MEARQLKQMISNALRSVRQALRGKITLAAAGKQVILLQAEGVSGETFNGAEYFQHAGFRSVPLANMQPIIVPLNGKSANGVIVACSNGKLFIADLAEGEVAVFNENDGVESSIILRNGRVIDMTCTTLNINASAGVNITTPTVTMSNDLVVGNNAQVAASTTTSTLSVTSAAPGASHMAGGIAADGEITSGGISVPHHTHGNVQNGLGNTDEAQ